MMASSERSVGSPRDSSGGFLGHEWQAQQGGDRGSGTHQSADLHSSAVRLAGSVSRPCRQAADGAKAQCSVVALFGLSTSSAVVRGTNPGRGVTAAGKTPICSRRRCLRCASPERTLVYGRVAADLDCPQVVLGLPSGSLYQVADDDATPRAGAARRWQRFVVGVLHDEEVRQRGTMSAAARPRPQELLFMDPPWWKSVTSLLSCACCSVPGVRPQQRMSGLAHLARPAPKAGRR